MAKLFLEVIAAPAFDEGAKAAFASKKNLRLVEVPRPAELGPEKYLRRHSGAGCRPAQLPESDLKVVTKRQPTPEEKRALLFAWKVCKHVKSNAILYARDGQTVGVGAGQMSRVDSCKLGAMKASCHSKGTVAASDAFFPFPDGVEEIAKAGATAIIQPGGSVRDQEVIEAADRLGLAMILPEYGTSGTRRRLTASGVLPWIDERTPPTRIHAIFKILESSDYPKALYFWRASPRAFSPTKRKM